MHPEILSICLFWFVTAFTPGPNNVVASYSGFNFGFNKTIPHILGVTLGFTSLVIEVDFGKEIGVKQSSAQITHYYNEENLKGKQVIGVCNFAEKNIAGVVSQVLILGSIDKEGKVILVHPSQKSENGLPIA